MIRIELPWLVFISLLVLLAGIFMVWISVEVGRRWRRRQALRYRIRCAVCSMEYEDRSRAVLPSCPRCGSLNEREYPPLF